jgi:hypothetical protein
MVDPDRPDDNMAHAHCMLDTQVYKHTLTVCNNYALSTTTTVARTHHNVNVIPTLPVLVEVIKLSFIFVPDSFLYSTVTLIVRKYRSVNFYTNRSFMAKPTRQV